LANICADLEEIEKVNQGLLETLTAGELAQVDREFKDPRPMQPTGTLVFSTNTLPALLEALGTPGQTAAYITPDQSRQSPHPP
jgi:hypothetical protein